jgi:hypothetical protein
MRNFFKVSVHIFPSSEQYYDNAYKIKENSTGFLICQNKEGHFKNWVDQLHHPRTDIDISLYGKEIEKNSFKNMEKELTIIFNFFKIIKKSKIENMCKFNNFFEMNLFKFENNNKEIDELDIDKDNRTNYFIVFNVNCSFKEIYEMNEFKEKLKEKGIYKFQDWDDIHTAIFLKRLSIQEIHKAFNKMLLLKKTYFELMCEMNKTRTEFFKKNFIKSKKSSFYPLDF